MKWMKGGMVAILLVIGAFIPQQSNAQILEIIQQALIAAIKAADLVVQKAQNATIDLQDAQKEIENTLSQTKLGEIADWTQKQKDLYQDYFNELWKVKTVISDLKEILDIISRQKQLMTEYSQDWARLQKDPHFSAAEVSYIKSVLTGIINESGKNLDQIIQVLESFSFQMSDADRMRIIRHASDNIETEISDLRTFNSQNIATSQQRAHDLDDLAAIKKLYGLPN